MIIQIQKGLNLHQFIFHGSQSYFLGMTQACQPVSIRVHHVEFVTSAQIVVLVFGGKHIVAVQDGSLGHHVGTCLVQGHGVCRCQHTEVRDNGGIIMVPAVTFRRNVHDEADVEVRFVFHYGKGIFRNLIVQTFRCIPVADYRCVMLAQSHTLPAAHTFYIVYFCFALCIEMHASWAQCFTQILQPIQCPVSILGCEEAWSSSLPPTLAHPIPKFFKAPPKPACS